MLENKKKKINKNSVYFVDKNELYEDLKEFIDKYKLDPNTRIPNKIGISIQKICNNFALRKEFRNYSFIDEMVSDAIEDCIAATYKFEPYRLPRDPHIAFKALNKALDSVNTTLISVDTWKAGYNILSSKKMTSLQKDETFNGAVEYLLSAGLIKIDDGFVSKVAGSNFIPTTKSEVVSPLTFYTQITYFAFVRKIESEKKESFIKHESLTRAMQEGLLSNQQLGDDEHFFTFSPNSDMNEDLLNKYYNK